MKNIKTSVNLGLTLINFYKSDGGITVEIGSIVVGNNLAYFGIKIRNTIICGVNLYYTERVVLLSCFFKIFVGNCGDCPYPIVVFKLEILLAPKTKVDGVESYIFSNTETLQAAWSIGEFECGISGKITLEEMKKMIDSIK